MVNESDAEGDCDNDGVLNIDDEFDNNACAWMDTDGDGFPDEIIDPNAFATDACESPTDILLMEDNCPLKPIYRSQR